MPVALLPQVKMASTPSEARRGVPAARTPSAAAADAEAALPAARGERVVTLMVDRRGERGEVVVDNGHAAVAGVVTGGRLAARPSTGSYRRPPPAH